MPQNMGPRRLLGYTLLKDQSMLIYSRDAMSAPLALLDEMLVAIRAHSLPRSNPEQFFSRNSWRSQW